mmetsp:Transcript_78927/g.213523  ORF Transcript_78927/g.213523 Transcript_78927/m.213523 type:complete len:376 (+) Transcript_78927:415-1542(+)
MRKGLHGGRDRNVHAEIACHGRADAQAHGADPELHIHAGHAVAVQVQGDRHELLLRLNMPLHQNNFMDDQGDVPVVALEHQLNLVVHRIIERFATPLCPLVSREQQPQHVLIGRQQILEQPHQVGHFQLEVAQRVLQQYDALQACFGSGQIARKLEERFHQGLVQVDSPLISFADFPQGLLQYQQLEWCSCTIAVGVCPPALRATTPHCRQQAIKPRLDDLLIWIEEHQGVRLHYRLHVAKSDDHATIPRQDKWWDASSPLRLERDQVASVDVVSAKQLSDTDMLLLDLAVRGNPDDLVQALWAPPRLPPGLRRQRGGVCCRREGAARRPTSRPRIRSSRAPRRQWRRQRHRRSARCSRTTPADSASSYRRRACH